MSKFYEFTIKFKNVKKKLDLKKYYNDIHFILSECYMANKINIKSDGFSFKTPMKMTPGDFREMGVLMADIPGLKPYVKVYNYTNRKTGKEGRSSQLFVRKRLKPSIDCIKRRVHAA